jgi:CHAT domain-containing protein
MNHFYGGLSSGLAKAPALAQAMRQVKESYPHPYYWAPFMLVGHA